MCCLVLMLGPRSLAQGTLALSHQAWSTEEGLPDASVHQVLQSRTGYLWIATERGLARFDGFNFEVFRHETDDAFASDDVSCIAQDSAGTLWFGTADGLVKREGSTFQRLAERDGLPSTRVLQIAAAGDGSVLVLTAAGVVRLQGGKASPLSRDLTEVTRIEQAADGSVQLFSADGSFLRYRQGALTEERRPIPGTEPLLSDQGLSGGMDVVATAHSITATGPHGRAMWPANQEQAQRRLTAMLVDAGGDVWIGTTHGLFVESLHGVAAPQAVDLLRGESILNLATDREGDLWIGTEGSGLHVLRPRAFRSEAAAAGEAVTSVVSAGDAGIWFGTRDSGVQHIFADGTVGSVALARLTSPRVLSLAPGMHGDLWVGTPDGLNHVSGAGTVKTYTSADGLPDDFVRSVVVDAQGIVWAGTRRGLARLEQEKVRVLTSSDGLPSDSIGPLLEGAPGTGQLWVGTSSGLALLRNGQVMHPADGGSEIVTALAADDAGGLWAGVHAQGLYRWSGNSFFAVPVAGLPREITGLAVDREGGLWMRGPQGVYRADNQALLACTWDERRCKVPVRPFGTQEGMPSEALAAEGMPQITQDRDGELWFSTRKGIAVANPARLPQDRTAPPVVIQKIAVDGVEIAPVRGGVRVGAGHSRYVFDYTALSFRMPSRVRYRYRLDGFDREWVDAGTARTAVYTGLTPGSYVFRVLADDGNGHWSETGASVDLRILPPVYRRWWFYLLVLLLGAALVMSGLRLRDRAVQRRFALVLEERNRMAREIHDTLAQDFVSVSLQLDIASGYLRGGRTEEAATQLQATRTLVKDGLKAARQSIWNLRANAGEDSLPTRLTKLAGRYSLAGKPVQVSIGGAFRKLDPAVEDEVMRIAGECLSNVDRHSGATEAQMDVRYEAEGLCLRVRDNGRGFSPEDALHLDGHYGVRGMRERAAALGAELRMESGPGQGTTVTLDVPLRAGKVAKI